MGAVAANFAYNTGKQYYMDAMQPPFFGGAIYFNNVPHTSIEDPLVKDYVRKQV